ncbi:MAG: hypothetical protein IKW38_05560 [Kiritimatiellae bacterium]|nr:hypothetical protein [Kiritimatiellia bacterium]
MDALIPAEDLRLLVSHLPARKVAELRAWAEVCERFLAVDSEARALVAKRQVMQSLGVAR